MTGTTGKTLFSGYPKYSAKAKINSVKALPSVTFGKNGLDYPWPAKGGMPSVGTRALRKDFAENKRRVLGKIK